MHGQARKEDGPLLKSIADQIAGPAICAFGRPVRGRRKASSPSSPMNLKVMRAKKAEKTAGRFRFDLDFHDSARQT